MTELFLSSHSSTSALLTCLDASEDLKNLCQADVSDPAEIPRRHSSPLRRRFNELFLKRSASGVKIKILLFMTEYLK